MKGVKISPIVGLAALLAVGCTPKKQEAPELISEAPVKSVMVVNGTDYLESAGYDMESPTSLVSDDWLSYEVDFAMSGRYLIEVKTSFNEGGTISIEDHYQNPDDNDYKLIESIVIGENGTGVVVDIPLKGGMHKMKVHGMAGEVTIKEMVFTLMP